MIDDTNELDALLKKTFADWGEGLSAQEVLDLAAAAKAWRDVATYFAEVMAANHDVARRKKSSSKSELRRQLHIAQSALACLRAEKPVGVLPSDRKYVLNRLQQSIDGAGE